MCRSSPSRSARELNHSIDTQTHYAHATKTVFVLNHNKYGPLWIHKNASHCLPSPEKKFASLALSLGYLVYVVGETESMDENNHAKFSYVGERNGNGVAVSLATCLYCPMKIWWRSVTKLKNTCWSDEGLVRNVFTWRPDGPWRVSWRFWRFHERYLHV